MKVACRGDDGDGPRAGSGWRRAGKWACSAATRRLARSAGSRVAVDRAGKHRNHCLRHGANRDVSRALDGAGDAGAGAGRGDAAVETRRSRGGRDARAPPANGNFANTVTFWRRHAVAGSEGRGTCVFSRGRRTRGRGGALGAARRASPLHEGLDHISCARMRTICVKRFAERDDGRIEAPRSPEIRKRSRPPWSARSIVARRRVRAWDWGMKHVVIRLLARSDAANGLNRPRAHTRSISGETREPARRTRTSLDGARQARLKLSDEDEHSFSYNTHAGPDRF